MPLFNTRFALLAACLTLAAASLTAQAPRESFATPNNGPGTLPMGTIKGERYKRLIIRGVTMLSGRGTPGTNRAMPPEGPVDIVIEGNRIVDIVLMDPVNTAGQGKDFQRATGEKIIDARGMFVMPGLVEMHAHLPVADSYGPRGLDYAYRLYLGHGVTTVRDAGTGTGLKTMTAQRSASDANTLVAPRLILCQRWPLPLRHWDVGNTPDKAREMVRQFKTLGADCIKISKSPGHYPDVMAAAAEEGKKLGMFTMVDLKVSESDAVVASNAGVKSIEHWYGIPDAALKGSLRRLAVERGRQESREAQRRHRSHDQERYELGSHDGGVRGQSRQLAGCHAAGARDADAPGRYPRRPRFHRAWCVQAGMEDVG